MAAGVVVMMMMILISTFWMKIFWTWRLAVTSLSEQSALTCFLWLHQVSLKVLTDKNLICFRNEKILNFNEKRKTNFKKYSWKTWPSYRRKHKIRKNSSKFPVQFCQFLPRDGDRVRDLWRHSSLRLISWLMYS